MDNQSNKVTKISAKAREARAAYQRQWRRENPERVRQTQAKYWEKKAAEEEKMG